MSLYIDTSDNRKILIILEKNKQKKEFFLNLTANNKSEKILDVISKALDKSKTSGTSLDGIFVKRGPGSFTGLRVGISIANALSFCLLIPVNKKLLGDIETPSY